MSAAPGRPNTLAVQQQALLDALLAWPADEAIQKIATCVIDLRARGLKAYQSNGHALAERAQRHPDCARFDAVPGAGPA